MDNLLAVAAGAVGATIVQEAVSRTVSLVLGKRKEKASQVQFLERFRKAAHEVEFVLERTAKLPIAEVSLLRDRTELKHDFVGAAACLLKLSSHKKRQASQGISISSLTSMGKDDDLFLSCDDVERFERFADSARSILRRVESGCSLRSCVFFPSPLVRHLFEGKTLSYETVQAGQSRRVLMWPARLGRGERGVEALVKYKYWDCKSPEKSFDFGLMLRLSESTDIVGVAVNCLQLLASQFRIVADAAMGELSQLANLQDVSHSYALPWVGIREEHNELIQEYRPDPLCCKAIGHVTCASSSSTTTTNNNNIVSSGLSHVFPEQVNFFSFNCYGSAPKYSLRRSSHEVGRRCVRRDQMPQLALAVRLAPHHVHNERQQASYAVEVIGDNGEEFIDVSIQHMWARR